MVDLARFGTRGRMGGMKHGTMRHVDFILFTFPNRIMACTHQGKLDRRGSLCEVEERAGEKVYRHIVTPASLGRLLRIARLDRRHQYPIYVHLNDSGWAIQRR